MNEEQEEKLSKLIGYIVEEESLGDEADPNETLRYFGEVEEFVNDLIKNARLDELNKASLGACNVAMADRDAYFYKRKQELNNSSPVEPEVIINKNAERTYIIYTDEGNLALSQEDILNTIDADLDMMDNNEEREWRVLRKDMTEEEINNLPVV